MSTPHSTPSDSVDLPISGAWMPGDPVGNRQFMRFATDRPFVVESGDTLSDITIAYETWGNLNADASNAILICHAWTGDAHAAGRATSGHPTPGWWDDLIGPGKYVDTDRWFVVCSNVLGGCQGSTGPASVHPVDGKPYGSRFPVVTIRDMVRAQAELRKHLRVDAWASVIGGSMGGMQAVEWAITYPNRVQSLVVLASNLQATAQQIAWSMIGRQAIMADPGWCGGDYYDEPSGGGPSAGLSIARQVAQVTFRSDNAFTDRFGRAFSVNQPDSTRFGAWQQFEVERYLAYHGAKLCRRFDANSYLVIGKALDLHDVARGRGDVRSALSRIACPSLIVGVDTDILYPAYQQQQIAEILTDLGLPCRYVELSSPHGHDAFLIHLDEVGVPIAQLLADVHA